MGSLLMGRLSPVAGHKEGINFMAVPWVSTEAPKVERKLCRRCYNCRTGQTVLDCVHLSWVYLEPLGKDGNYPYLMSLPLYYRSFG
jgi:hypothetical protein